MRAEFPKKGIHGYGSEYSFVYSDLCSWLNEEFYDSAFSSEEKEYISENSFYDSKTGEFLGYKKVYLQDKDSNISKDMYKILENMGVNLKCTPTEYSQQKSFRKYNRDTEWYWSSAVGHHDYANQLMYEVYGMNKPYDGRYHVQPANELLYVRPMITITFPSTIAG